jgi:hypothetical protein
MYILLNDCFKTLSMSLFGWWVDDEATINTVPFCNALVQVAVATNNEKLRRFVEDDMLPALIRRLCDSLPCTVQRTISMLSLFGWLVADGWCWFVLREEYYWLVGGDWFVLREKYCWLVVDKPSEQVVI